MVFNPTQLQRMAEIFNEAILKSAFSDIQVTADDFDPIGSFGGASLIKFHSDKNPLETIFKRLAQNRQVDRGQFFHFKDMDVAKLIVQHQSVQVSNMLSNHENDFAEYTEFFQRLGIINQLIPATFITDRTTVNSRKNRPIDEDRDDTLILCMSKEGHKERFWDQYAKKDTGVCLVLRFLDFVRDDSGVSYDFRDVFYDDGYQFEFLNKVNHLFSVEFGRVLFIEGISKFARFYKRGSYSWENETRLAFDFGKGLFPGPFLKTKFDIQTNGNRRYIVLPLKGSPIPNPLFTLDIDEVIIGKNVPDTDREDLTALLKANFPNAKVWQREYTNY